MKATVTYNPAEMISAVKPQAAPIIRDATEFLRLLMIASFGTAKHGRPGRFRQASAPGEAPAIQTGNMFRNLLLSFPAWNIGELTINTPYARILEEEKDRPFVRPAIDQLIGRFNAERLGEFGGVG